jgi:hypothetical protein
MTSPAPDTAPAGPLTLREQDLAALARTRGWIRFLGGFSLAGALLFGLMIPVASLTNPARSPLDRVVVMATLVIAALATGVWGIFCWGYASGLAAFGRGRPGGLVRAFRNLRRIWVLMVIGFALSPLVGLAQILGLMPTRPP